MTLKTAIVITTICAASAAWAHGPMLGSNGGQRVDAGDYHLELVAQDRTVTVYLADGSDMPVVADAFKGTAILVTDGKAHRIPLAPAGGNKLSGTAPATLPPQPKGAVQMTTPNGTTVQAKFN